MRELLVVRHGHARSNARDVVSGLPPGEGLSERGVDEARALRDALEAEAIDLAVSSELERARQTLDLALGGRAVPRLVLATLNEILFGAFEGGPLEDYRAWAWSNEPAADCPGGGESRLDAALRVARALDSLLAHDEERILVVSHALPIRYLLDAAEGLVPTPRITPVGHAAPAVLPVEAVERAVTTLRGWAAMPVWAGPPGSLGQAEA